MLSSGGEGSPFKDDIRQLADLNSKYHKKILLCSTV